MKKSAFLLLLGITTAVWADIQPCNHVEEPHQEVAAFLAASAPDTGARQAAAIRAAREGDSTDLDAIRKGRNSSAEAAATDASLTISDAVVPSASGGIPIRLYTPSSLAGGSKPAAVLYLHGGGWTIGSIRSCARFCRALATASGAIVAAIDYRLAPEHPYPAALEDTLIARQWLQQQLGTERIYLAGDSAGGNLAIAAAMQLAQNRSQATVSGLILFYPVTYADADGSDSWLRNGKGYALDAELMEEFNEAYAPAEARQRDPLVSPLLSPALHLLPPILLISAQFDILHDQGREFARQAEKAGVPVRARCYEGASHLFITMPGMDTYFRRAVRDAAAFIRAAQH